MEQADKTDKHQTTALHFFAMETASVKMFLNVVVWPASDKEKKKFITD